MLELFLDELKDIHRNIPSGYDDYTGYTAWIEESMDVVKAALNETRATASNTAS